MENLIRTNEEACRQYLDYTSVDAMLKWQFDETTVPVIPKKPNVITFRRVLMAAAALLVLGLGIHFWHPIEPKGTNTEELPVLVESKYDKPHTLSGWSFLPALDADYEVLGPARVRLNRGEVYAASTPYPKGNAPIWRLRPRPATPRLKGPVFTYPHPKRKGRRNEDHPRPRNDRHRWLEQHFRFCRSPGGRTTSGHLQDRTSDIDAGGQLP